MPENVVSEFDTAIADLRVIHKAWSEWFETIDQPAPTVKTPEEFDNYQRQQISAAIKTSELYSLMQAQRSAIKKQSEPILLIASNPALKLDYSPLDDFIESFFADDYTPAEYIAARKFLRLLGRRMVLLGEKDAPDDDMLTVKEIAVELGLSEKRVYELARIDTFGKKINGRFKKSAAKAYKPSPSKKRNQNTTKAKALRRVKIFKDTL